MEIEPALIFGLSVIVVIISVMFWLAKKLGENLSKSENKSGKLQYRRSLKLVVPNMGVNIVFVETLLLSFLSPLFSLNPLYLEIIATVVFLVPSIIEISRIYDVVTSKNVREYLNTDHKGREKLIV